LCLCDVLNYGVDDILNAHDNYWRFYIVIKSIYCAHIDSPPRSQYSNNQYQRKSFMKQSNQWKEIMEYAKIGAPVFDGNNYTFLNKRMKNNLQTQGFDVWKSVVDGYSAPVTPPTNKHGKKLSENNSKDKGTILSSLVDSVFVKVMHCDSAKYLWDKL
jgi:hypothetical protein